MKKKMMALAALVLAVVVTGYSVSGTYAKYTSAKEVSDSARVAKWDIKLGTEQIWSSSATFNIFDYTDAGLGGTVNGLIAPGTEGTASVAAIKNDSEVNAEYSIVYTVTNDNNVPIEFYDAKNSAWVTSTSGLTVTGKLAPGESSSAVDLKWRWSFENGISTDENDTAYGKNGNAEVIVKATITATQLDGATN